MNKMKDKLFLAVSWVAMVTFAAIFTAMDFFRNSYVLAGLCISMFVLSFTLLALGVTAETYVFAAALGLTLVGLYLDAKGLLT